MKAMLDRSHGGKKRLKNEPFSTHVEKTPGTPEILKMEGRPAVRTSISNTFLPMLSSGTAGRCPEIFHDVPR